ncbi:hypothetical protein [Pendulispora albinea]|uniref:Outer membrane protein beta-barrel domain-containing protein n=1 Tax=Pendulispora albinea TaxID=2741071 RepID=A0ABZ2LLI9_9BACT
MRTMTFLAAAIACAYPSISAAQDANPSKTPGETTPATGGPELSVADLTAQAPAPPPLHVPYLQYGVSLAGEFVLTPGPVCDVATQPPACVLNSGGGIAARVGVRTAGRFYFGGTYSFTKQDSDSLYRLAILQQVRAETRYYLDTGRDVEPMLLAGIGLGGYGNEWGIDTGGPLGFLGVGVELQITRRTVVGIAASYRALYLSSFVDSSETRREGGVASLFGLDLILEARDPL